MVLHGPHSHSFCTHGVWHIEGMRLRKAALSGGGVSVCPCAPNPLTATVAGVPITGSAPTRLVRGALYPRGKARAVRHVSSLMVLQHAISLRHTKAEGYYRDTTSAKDCNKVCEIIPPARRGFEPHRLLSLTARYPQSVFDAVFAYPPTVLHLRFTSLTRRSTPTKLRFPFLPLPVERKGYRRNGCAPPGRFESALFHNGSNGTPFCSWRGLVG